MYEKEAVKVEQSAEDDSCGNGMLVYKKEYANAEINEYEAAEIISTMMTVGIL